MKLKQIYELALEMGRKADPDLADNFPDCQILNPMESEVNTLYAGIDIGVGELLLVDRLNQSGYGVDAVLSHHPQAKGYYLMSEVGRIQQQTWIRYGVDRKVAHRLADKMIKEYWLEAASANGLRARDAARQLKLPLLCLHTAVDNLVQDFFLDFLRGKDNSSLIEVLDLVQKIEECGRSAADGVKAHLAGKISKDTKLGCHMVDMTGGMDPPMEIFGHLKKAGVDTMVGMHYGLEHLKAMESCGMAAVICGHMACDSLGLNIFCDQLQAKGVKVIAGAGFYRVERKPK